MPKPYIPNDSWTRKAREEGYRARSVYKLKELDERFRLLGPGMTVLDLGAAPGSWLQYAAERVGPTGTVIGVDLRHIEPIDGVVTLQADITSTENVTKILSAWELTLPPLPPFPSFDLLLSDLAPSTSGMKGVDQWKSIELARAVLAIAGMFLKPGGRVAMKMLRGEDFDAFLAELRRTWKSVKPAQVRASRDRSKEIYLVLQ